MWAQYGDTGPNNLPCCIFFVVLLTVILVSYVSFFLNCFRHLPPNINLSVVGSFFTQYSLLIYSPNYLHIYLLISLFPYALSPTLPLPNFLFTRTSLALSIFFISFYSFLNFPFSVLHPSTVSDEYLQNATIGFATSICLYFFSCNDLLTYLLHGAESFLRS